MSTTCRSVLQQLPARPNGARRPARTRWKLHPRACSLRPSVRRCSPSSAARSIGFARSSARRAARYRCASRSSPALAASPGIRAPGNGAFRRAAPGSSRRRIAPRTASASKRTAEEHPIRPGVRRSGAAAALRPDSTAVRTARAASPRRPPRIVEDRPRWSHRRVEDRSRTRRSARPPAGRPPRPCRRGDDGDERAAHRRKRAERRVNAPRNPRSARRASRPATSPKCSQPGGLHRFVQGTGRCSEADPAGRVRQRLRRQPGRAAEYTDRCHAALGEQARIAANLRPCATSRRRPGYRRQRGRLRMFHRRFQKAGTATPCRDPTNVHCCPVPPRELTWRKRSARCRPRAPDCRLATFSGRFRTRRLLDPQHQRHQQQLLELGRESVDHPLRVRAQALVGDEAELHAAGVGQDAHADADVARRRDPEHRLAQRRAAELQRLGRAGDVGHHRGGLLRRARAARPAAAWAAGGDGEHAEGEQRLVAAFISRSCARTSKRRCTGCSTPIGSTSGQAELVAELPRPCPAASG